ncbi:unnamed protein product [Phytophthora fragariaefolia]|uniref:Unnamed protein product n=1 Tax=Phytophthora fragariaefolia TaxID=1490495 RepID=A0A9W7DEY3_9STRA|nr:unnamed protein product [Phytophthora fragariaefolia]
MHIIYANPPSREIEPDLTRNLYAAVLSTIGAPDLHEKKQVYLSSKFVSSSHDSYLSIDLMQNEVHGIHVRLHDQNRVQPTVLDGFDRELTCALGQSNELLEGS